LGLLSVTGMRLGEAIRLEVGDVDLDQGLLTIRQTKFGKSRLAPIADSTRSALADTARDRFAKRLAPPQFFISGRRTALDPGHIHRTFYQLLDQAEVHAPWVFHASVA
jgi:integrase